MIIILSLLGYVKRFLKKNKKSSHFFKKTAAFTLII